MLPMKDFGGRCGQIVTSRANVHFGSKAASGERLLSAKSGHSPTTILGCLPGDHVAERQGASECWPLKIGTPGCICTREALVRSKRVRALRSAAKSGTSASEGGHMFLSCRRVPGRE